MHFQRPGEEKSLLVPVRWDTHLTTLQRPRADRKECLPHENQENVPLERSGRVPIIRAPHLSLHTTLRQPLDQIQNYPVSQAAPGLGDYTSTNNRPFSSVIVDEGSGLVQKPFMTFPVTSLKSDPRQAALNFPFPRRPDRKAAACVRGSIADSGKDDPCFMTRIFSRPPCLYHGVDVMSTGP